MPVSEKSYRDREGKSKSLRDACTGFTPAFTPPASALTTTNFTIFIGTVMAANDLVDTLAANYSTSATTRVATVQTIKDTLTQALGYLKSNKAWKSEYTTAKMVVGKVRGPRAAKVVPPVEGEPPIETTKRNQGQRAYVEVAAHLNKFIGVLTGTAGYAPTVVEIQVSTLSGLLSQITGLNNFLSDTEQKLATAQNKRRTLYEEEDDGLADRFQAIKEAVKGQYGFKSDEYETASAITW